MKEQKYILEKCTSFEPKDIFDCGQCFRWNEEKDGSYTGIFRKNVLNVKKQGEKVIFEGICEGDIEKICYEYFDLGTSYEEIKERLAKIDEHLKQSVEYGKGIIERISKKYGEKIEYRDKKYYTFPEMNRLREATVEDLRGLGLGFRDKRIYETTKMFIEKKITLEELENEENTKKLRDRLMELPGVGGKVADCIMFFGLKRFEVFPVDVWVRRVMNELYIKEEDENKVSKELLQNLAKEKYNELAGLAQQYLFYQRRGK